MRALATHLTWNPREAVEAKDALLSLHDPSADYEHAGIAAIREAIEQRKVDLTSQLLTRPPSDNAADYERLIGQIKGLEEFPEILAGILENGRKAEHALRELDEN